MIEVKHLCKRYGDFEALRDVSFSISRGEVVGLLGPNGAGKTTTMKILTGFLYPSGGSAAIAGHDVVTDSLEVRRRIGYLPENAPLYTDMQAIEFLEAVAEIHGLGRKERRERIGHAAERCGIRDVLTVPIGHLSKGYRQRVGIAFTLLHDPDLLILDEPTSGLDPNQIQDIRRLLKELGEDKTIILSTHILREVEVTCSRVLIINRGQLVADASPDDLRKAELLVVAGRGAAPETVRTKLLALDGVNGAEVERRKGEGERFFARLRVEPSDALAGRIFELAKDEGWTLTELRFENASLEDVFQELTGVN